MDEHSVFAVTLQPFCEQHAPRGQVTLAQSVPFPR